jgi:hypothetical protein
MPAFDARETLRFGDFELDIAAYELRHQGRAVKLERRPMDVLRRSRSALIAGGRASTPSVPVDFNTRCARG